MRTSEVNDDAIKEYNNSSNKKKHTQTANKISNVIRWDFWTFQKKRIFFCYCCFLPFIFFFTSSSRLQNGLYNTIEKINERHGWEKNEEKSLANENGTHIRYELIRVTRAWKFYCRGLLSNENIRFDSKIYSLILNVMWRIADFVCLSVCMCDVAVVVVYVVYFIVVTSHSLSLPVCGMCAFCSFSIRSLWFFFWQFSRYSARSICKRTRFRT